MTEYVVPIVRNADRWWTTMDTVAAPGDLIEVRRVVRMEDRTA